jgi:hypothetical protein
MGLCQLMTRLKRAWPRPLMLPRRRRSGRRANASSKSARLVVADSGRLAFAASRPLNAFDRFWVFFSQRCPNSDASEAAGAGPSSHRDRARAAQIVAPDDPMGARHFGITSGRRMPAKRTFIKVVFEGAAGVRLLRLANRSAPAALDAPGAMRNEPPGDEMNPLSASWPQLAKLQGLREKPLGAPQKALRFLRRSRLTLPLADVQPHRAPRSPIEPCGENSRQGRSDRLAKRNDEFADVTFLCRLGVVVKHRRRSLDAADVEKAPELAEHQLIPAADDRRIVRGGEQTNAGAGERHDGDDPLQVLAYGDIALDLVQVYSIRALTLCTETFRHGSSFFFKTRRGSPVHAVNHTSSYL